VSTLLLTRHAETVWHAENRYAGGDSDIDLTPAGVRQAERLAEWVRARNGGVTGSDRTAGAAGAFGAAGAIGASGAADLIGAAGAAGAGGAAGAAGAPSSAGAAGAANAAGAAGTIVTVVSSPVRRAQETAAPAAAALGVSVETVADLREVGFGIAEGRTLAELDPDVVAAFRGGDPFPGAEAPNAAAERVAAALRAVAARHPDRTVLVVAHGTALRLGLCALLGLPPARYRQVFPRMANVAIAELALGADGPAGLLSLNVPCTTTKE
jgi:2,3-bisphosphoglycerate-dependent phosphoglycerate mutase